MPRTPFKPIIIDGNNVPADPRIKKLHALPDWWRGAANTRLELAKRAHSDTEAADHLRMAADYERRIKESVA
jgi:hypothetical protein